MIKEHPIKTISDILVKYKRDRRITNPMTMLAITGRKIAEKKFIIEIGVPLKEYHNVGANRT
jgi:phosphoribosylaminoimidazole carboxylase (NCAIR synthetase)